MLAFTCAFCQKTLAVDDELAGQQVRCPGCQGVVAVPHLAAALIGELVASAAEPEEENTRSPSAAQVGNPAPPLENLAQSGRESLSDVGGETGLGAGPKTEPTRSFAVHTPWRAEPPERPGSGGLSPELWSFLAPPEQPDEIGRLGPYRVLQVLGAGGMGVVFRAEDPALQRLVALKAMRPALAGSPAAKERFFREARSAAALKHPHIVTIFQVGEDRGAPFLAMEFLEGESLDECLRRESRLPIPDVLRIGREVAEGLSSAHANGLIHRDIKPGNIWLESRTVSGGVVSGGEKEQGSEHHSPLTTHHSPVHVKLLDFGLARAMGDQTQLTQSGAIVGTPAYMAPEQAGGRAVDHRCDLFSLGCVLYRLCTGQMAFKGNDTISILSALALETPPSPRQVNAELPAALSDLVMQLLAKQPEQRPASARLVIEALREIERQPPEPSRSDDVEVTHVGDIVTLEGDWVETEAADRARPLGRRPRADYVEAEATAWDVPRDQRDQRRRRASSEAGLFAAKGLTGPSPAFLFIGTGLMFVLLLSVFLPWRTVVSGTEIRRGGIEFGGFEMPLPEVPGMQGFKTSVNLSGMQTPGALGVLTLIAAIAGAVSAFAAAFVPNRSVLKAGLWTAFATALGGMALALIAALGTTTESAEAWFGRVAGAQKGAWGAWVAAVAGLAAALMFLLALLTMSSGSRPRREVAGVKRDRAIY